MNIVWCSWKDKSHPKAGGAEVVTNQILKRLVADGHEVTLLTANYKGAKDKTKNVKVVHMGNRLTVYYHAWRYYRKQLKPNTDLVVDEMNTLPFFAKWYAGTPTILMVHQLARKVWFYQLPWIFGLVGYVLEPMYLFLLRDQPVVTVSRSTKKDLMRFGFLGKKIKIISEGVELLRAKSLNNIKKYKRPTMLSLGAMRAMKRTLDQIEAFEIAKESMPELQLKIAGDSDDPYGQKVLEAIENSPYKKDIEYLGKVDRETKQELMQRSHVIAVTSVKEGWGLIVSEAASQGTPAVVYDADGLRDSVQHERTGVVTYGNTPRALASAINSMPANPDRYEQLRHAGWEVSEKMTFDRCYRDFTHAIKELV
jgi:glycosyltransferase involved in cell wall biosynthesis